MLGSKISNSPENANFAVSFILLELRREQKEDYMKVEESKGRLDYRIVNKIMCSQGGNLSEALRKLDYSGIS